MLIAARDLVMRVPEADEARVRVEMSGNLCRCTGYRGIVRAILSVLELRRAGNDSVIDAAPKAAPAAFVPFAATAAVSPAASVAPAPAAAASSPAQKQSGTVIEDEFTVDHPLGRVWDIFADMPAVAACLPGAEISEHTPTSLKGKITTKFGPMRAAFAGAAALERDEAAKRGAIRGNGTDSLSGSRARGDISYQLFDAGNGRTRVAVAIDYSLQGPLAQFSRGGLVREFVKKMVADFAANLNARLGAPAGAAPKVAPVMEINAASIFWSWLKKLFGSKS
jgi:carbon-monoxide dehydrogenase small subunit